MDALDADSSQITSPALLAVLWHNNLLVDRFAVTHATDRFGGRHDKGLI